MTIDTRSAMLSLVKSLPSSPLPLDCQSPVAKPTALASAVNKAADVRATQAC